MNQPICSMFPQARTRPATAPLPPVAPAREIELYSEHSSPEIVNAYRALERGHDALRAARMPRPVAWLGELVAAFALAHPDRPLSDVGVVEFLEWHSDRRGT